MFISRILWALPQRCFRLGEDWGSSDGDSEEYELEVCGTIAVGVRILRHTASAFIMVGYI